MSSGIVQLGREHFATAIVCASCNQAGSIDCEKIGSRGEHVRSIMIGLSDGFYRVPGATQFDDPQIICNRCGAVQRDCLGLSL
jgi:ribosomal protein L37E